MRAGLSLIDSLLALGTLSDLPRTGWIQRGVRDPETVGAHVLSTCFLVLALGPRVAPRLDVERAIALALVHDAPEALLGDLPRTAARLLPAGAKAAAEDRAARELLEPLSEGALRLWDEIRAGGTREARFVKLVDRLQLGVELVALHRAGRRGLEEFAETVLGLDCAEFEPVASLRAEILGALGQDGARA
ncbi:MAG: HD domain-containing protein [Planctomycetes bacterium]|nr:HD domain-containing protein [Planctomycetota bacterium]